MTETDICNLALSRVGNQQLIADLDEGSTPARLCRLHYSLSRDSMLRDHPWNFSIKRATLALSSTTPNHEFGYQHTLPDDCLKVIRTDWEADGTIGPAVYGFPGLMGTVTGSDSYRIEGRFLLAQNSTVKIEYIARITDTAQFDSEFVDALAARLAAELCMALTNNQAATKALWEIAGAKLTAARLADAQEGTPRDVVDNSGWLAARV